MTEKKEYGCYEIVRIQKGEKKVDFQNRLNWI